jgi:hypothetical protein
VVDVRRRVSVLLSSLPLPPLVMMILPITIMRANGHTYKWAAVFKLQESDGLEGGARAAWVLTDAHYYYCY